MPVNTAGTAAVRMLNSDDSAFFFWMASTPVIAKCPQLALHSGDKRGEDPLPNDAGNNAIQA